MQRLRSCPTTRLRLPNWEIRGHQIASNEWFSHRHMSVGREEGNDTSSPSPSRTSECVSGPSVTEGSNPQDRVEPKPDHSRPDILCLGQTIRGSVRPGGKHEIGNIHLPHSGGDGVESGQSCPELGLPVRLCIPSNKPDKGLSKQGQNRKRRDHPDSPRLAESGVVPGPIRSRDRLSNISPTSQGSHRVWKTGKTGKKIMVREKSGKSQGILFWAKSQGILF